MDRQASLEAGEKDPNVIPLTATRAVSLSPTGTLYGAIDPPSPFQQRSTPLNIDTEQQSVKASDSAESIKRYSKPAVRTYTSYWRKRLFGLDDWVLVNYDALPDWMKDNDYIIEGNRPPLPWRNVFQSMLYLHNQTGNIISHLICGLAMTALMICTYVLILAPQPDVTVFEYVAWSIFFFCAQYVLYVSAVFHLTMCRSKKTSFVGGCLDYTGIVFMIYGSIFLAVYYEYECNRTWLYIYLGVFSALAIGCAISMYVPVMNTPKMRPWRSLLFCVFGLFGGIPLIHFIVAVGASEAFEYGMAYVIAEGVVYILGAVLFAARFPERLSPGLFDYWGHSHQFHHLCSGAGGFLHWYAMYLAFHRKHSAPCPWL